MSEVIDYTPMGSVALVTMNRPAARNALDAEALAGLTNAFARFADDTDALVLVITGAGTDAFCAGADLKAIAAGWRPDPAAWPVLGSNVHLDKPVIAAVNGVAYGGGFLLAQSCDLCVAASTAQFGITEARWGRGVDWAWPLPRLIPPRVAMELLLTAKPIDARRAERVGLVNAIVDPRELIDHTITLARTIASNAQTTVRAAKAVVYQSLLHDRAERAAEAAAIFAPVYAGVDAAEGPSAFSDRRPPLWSTAPATSSDPRQGGTE